MPRLLVVAVVLMGVMAPSVTHATEPRTRYVVVLEEGAGPILDVAREAAPGRTPRRVYRHALRGFAVELSASEAEGLRSRPGVRAVVRDRKLGIAETQEWAPWGLDRIDQRPLPRDTTYTYATTGAGVTAYVLDTGILGTHQDFGGRVRTGVNFVKYLPFTDCNGHGTHVAGTIGGTRFGVAKEAELVPVRVLDCLGMGWLSDILKGVDWVTLNHAAGQPAVANMSLGGPSIKVLNQAVKASIADGVTYTVAAGNSGTDACEFSPARVGPALTVSASNPKDTRPAWANHGPCVDLFAPGTNILSAWWNGGSKVLSGTSMAAPHVAGVAAQYLETHPSATPAEVRTALSSMTTKKAITSAKSLNNHLLFTDL